MHIETHHRKTVSRYKLHPARHPHVWRRVTKLASRPSVKIEGVILLRGFFVGIETERLWDSWRFAIVWAWGLHDIKY